MQYDIRRLDVYRKIPKDLTEPTYTGACISIISCLFMACLFFSELASFLTVEIVSEMYVDTPSYHQEMISVRLSVTIPKMECKYLGIDIQDELGRHDVGFVENMERIPVDEDTGCQMNTRFMVNKVPGNFHISSHSTREQPKSPDMGHIIHELEFGDVISESLNIMASFNPLANRSYTKSTNPYYSYDYILQVVPTVVEGVGGHKLLNPYQYTYAFREYVQHGAGPGSGAVPVIWFRYQLMPITVKYIEKRKPIYSFLTTVCAIVGGTFTVAGIIDSLVFTATGIFKKAQLGKLN